MRCAREAFRTACMKYRGEMVHVDVCSAVYQNLAPDLRADGKLPEVPRKLVEADRFGVKSGRGAFDYPPQEREAKRSDRDRNYLALLKQLYSGVAPGARSR